MFFVRVNELLPAGAGGMREFTGRKTVGIKGVGVGG